MKADITSFLSLIRWRNLLILAFCLFTFHALLQRTADYHGLELRLSEGLLSLLGVSLLSLTSAGYLINALMDVTTDAVNHPHRQWIPVPFSERKVRQWYMLSLVTGFLPACWLAAYLDLWPWLVLYPLIGWMLHRYSNTWKGSGSWGNGLVALLSGSVPLLLLIPERALLRALPYPSNQNLWVLFLGFAVFAFLVSLFREVVKDLEDVEGDKVGGWQTLAVTAGSKRAKNVAVITGLLSFAILLSGAILFEGATTFKVGLLTMAALQVFLTGSLMRSSDAVAYRRISQGARCLLAGGLILTWLAP